MDFRQFYIPTTTNVVVIDNNWYYLVPFPYTTKINYDFSDADDDDQRNLTKSSSYIYTFNRSNKLNWNQANYSMCNNLIGQTSSNNWNNILDTKKDSTDSYSDDYKFSDEISFNSNLEKNKNGLNCFDKCDCKQQSDTYLYDNKCNCKQQSDTYLYDNQCNNNQIACYKTDKTMTKSDTFLYDNECNNKQITCYKTDETMTKSDTFLYDNNFCKKEISIECCDNQLFNSSKKKKKNKKKKKKKSNYKSESESFYGSDWDHSKKGMIHALMPSI